MSKNEEDPPNSGDADANLDVDNNGEDGGGDGDDDHGEAAEILTDLLQNGQIIPASANGDNADAGRTDTSSGATEAAAAACRENTQVGEAQQAAIQQMMQHLKLGGVALPSASADQEKRHAFWDTQPMLINTDENDDEKPKKSKAKAITDAKDISDQPDPRWHKPIIPDKPQSELRQDPYNMPKGFEWSEVNIADPAQRTEVYDLLYQNYVEDDECMFRFDYSRDFLTWALTPPGYLDRFHLGVRSSKSGRLMAFITGVPARVRVYEEERAMVEVNFLCVHKKLRSKRLAPVLIKEITRRVNHTGVYQAVYTAGVVLPGHVASCRYYHRTLNAKKLVEVGFTRLHPGMTMARMQKRYKLPASTSLQTLRPMTPADVPAAHKLVMEYLQKFKLSVVFTEEEFAHWLMPREGVVSSFVNAKKKEGAEEEEEEITDFCSYYHLHSSVLGNPKHNTLHAAYSFYNVATTVDLTELMRDCLILAKNEGHDVFNALNLMENDRFLEDLKFGKGDGNLQYYVYNWLCPTMEHGDVGLVLL
mmetsp:Transcript_7173/g.17840  ORF Transcript_7173/g.17840 Transcript_7173/m.17840 type:complete len:533 (+) Transcript_7173:171-1769(+)|eukprot:CAMPEP_0181120270 /NCGR_PEP_ID=MMETSP1071-20121207/24066_1 /TAXON_ID=35127 /ORGANISM="Thalassiosira sp., Strain NH16" /LENGTH=532 /DNA_ID=CAMNT_0023204913 /DNA_START=94 /DNA_END=1692 /DNA_ORIENTATION=+